MSYKSEFGEGFDLGFDLSTFPKLIDKSWHNDECPRFEWDHYVLWVNDADCAEFERYGIYHGFINEDDDPEIDYSVVYLQTNCPKELVNFLTDLFNKKALS